jgi:predicted HAD superfamily Cof-like phosphohydrolase
MNWDFIQEVQEWNDVRGNYGYSVELEESMIVEEVLEYVRAIDDEDLVAQADALADILVVAVGSLYKLCGNDKIKMEDILLAVTAANNTKSSTKNKDGKITKPDNFVGPERQIAKVLFYEG